MKTSRIQSDFIFKKPIDMYSHDDSDYLVMGGSE